MNKITLAKCNGTVQNVELESYDTTPTEMAKNFSQPVGGIKDGTYFVRSTGTKRNNQDTANTADILILDGDSRINKHGEIIAGAPNPALVHLFLAKAKIPHFIYSSYSNGEKGDGYFKYRVIIFIKYSRKQLPILLEYFHELLHNENILLVNVKENRTWSQPWYFPRCPNSKKHLFKHYKHLNSNELNADDICTKYEVSHSQLKREPTPPRLAKNYSADSKISPIRLFNEHWKSPVNYLMTQGYRYKKRRLLPPHCKETSMAGVQICRNCIDGIERIYSHHGNDPLSDGLPHDSFDCFKILECNNDEKNALNEIGNTFFINGITLEKHLQHEYVKKNNSTPIDWSLMEVGS